MICVCLQDVNHCAYYNFLSTFMIVRFIPINVCTCIYIYRVVKEYFADIWAHSDCTVQESGMPFWLWLFYDVGSRIRHRLELRSHNYTYSDKISKISNGNTNFFSPQNGLHNEKILIS